MKFPPHYVSLCAGRKSERIPASLPVPTKGHVTRAFAFIYGGLKGHFDSVAAGTTCEAAGLHD